MPLELDPISGVPESSMGTVEGGDAFFESRLHSSDWLDASDDDKQKALNEAAEIINQFRYIGFKTVSTQLSEWPRSGILMGGVALDSAVVPESILMAQYLIAQALLSGIDPERELKGRMVTSRGYSSVRTTYDPRYTPEHVIYGIPSALAWSYLSSFFDRGSEGVVRLHRVN